jgi:hypothetical protein
MQIVLAMLRLLHQYILFTPLLLAFLAVEYLSGVSLRLTLSFRLISQSFLTGNLQQSSYGKRGRVQSSTAAALAFAVIIQHCFSVGCHLQHGRLRR